MTVGDQVTERDEADQPALHLPGVGFDRQVNVVAGIIGAHGDRAALDVEPALSGARAGQHHVQDGALLGKLGRDRVLVQAPHERPPVAVVFGGIPEGPLSGPVPHGPDKRSHRLPRRCQRVTSGPAPGPGLTANQPAPLEQSEPLSEHGPADPGNPPVDFVEATGANHEFADNQRRPPIAQHLDACRDRAVVRVVRHVPIMPGGPGPG